ncbi:MAG: bifunctional homocysteine S-methyltransferase/methylenetetrahydrofolate reductase [Clostridia bacterium]|nr:bifunctional homocysteine S-methyltransferase/methylenetetrahydrofolate reductase [Clostridia bacterium]
MMEIREYLKEKNLLFDGSMGTYFAEKTHRDAKECELSCLTEPEITEQIHKEYIKSGAKAIKTNTFSTSYAGKERAAELLRAAAKAAKRAAEGEDVYIFADMGPVEDKEKPFAEYKEKIDIFCDEGITNFLFETLSGNEGVSEAAEYIKGKNPESFIILSFAVNPAGYTSTGRYYKSLIAEAESSQFIDAAGLNCMSGPSHLIKLAKKLEIKKPLSLMPNAGYPTVLGSRAVYGKNAAYFAECMLDAAESGIAIMGGCCGTTPEYIEQCGKIGLEVKRQAAHEVISEEKRAGARVENRFLEKLMRGERVIAAELDPPEGTDIEFFVSGAAELHNAGADLITIADCPVARPRMDSALLSCKLKREMDIDTLPHMACRDRNLNAMKALLLGLNAEGVGNVLAITGDPVPSDKRDEVKSVFNFNSRMLIKFIATLNETEFAYPMNICAALNINAVNFNVQIKLAEEKITNGASVFLTQPLMTEEALQNLKRAHEELNAKILCGIMPIVSYRNAVYMNNEIAGITVDERIIESFRGKERSEAEKLGFEIALKAVEAAKDFCDGYYFITPFKRVSLIRRLIEETVKRF